MSQPKWINEKGQIDEVLFCSAFIQRYCVHYNGNVFTTRDGTIDNDWSMQQKIFYEIVAWVRGSLAQKTESLLRTLKLMSYGPTRPMEDSCIHLANGTYYPGSGFDPEKLPTVCRLQVSFNPDAPAPGRWLAFLQDLLEPEDIPTLQEYLGYCLLATTRAQKMLILLGKGGEGKSQIGFVMQAIFGSTLNTSSIQKVEHNKFARADLEGKLLMVDDDMDMNALKKTNYIKSIVTAQGKMDVERKGQQSYQAALFVRFLCFGNGGLTALHDRSDGFYRRQIILTTRDRDPDRVDNPFLREDLLKETEGILLWMLEGLWQLICRNFQFTISPQARKNMDTLIRESNNIVEFLESEGYVKFGPQYRSGTNQLYSIYRDWCTDNALPPFGSKTFFNYLNQNQARLHIASSKNIPMPGGRAVRGYLGLGICQPDFSP